MKKSSAGCFVRLVGPAALVWGLGCTPEGRDEPRAASESPLTDVSVGQCSNGVPKIYLRTSRSYLRTGADYKFRVGVYRCTAGSYVIQDLPSASNVGFQVRYVDDLPDTHGYQSFQEAGGSCPLGSLGNHCFTTSSAWSAVLDGQSEVRYVAPSNVRAMIFRVAAVPGYPGAQASDWVRVNYNTRYGLIDLALGGGAGDPIFPVVQDGEEAVFGGRAFAMEAGGAPVFFQDRTLVKPVSGTAAQQAAYGRPPSNDDNDRVFTWLKDVSSGYHNPRYPWGGSAGSIFTTGRSNINFWMKRASLGGSDASDEAYVSNNFEFGEWAGGGDAPPYPDWSNPAKFDPVAYPSHWSSKAVYSSSCSETRCIGRPHHSASTNAQGFFRDYIFVPRFVADGWGVWVPHTPDATGAPTALWGAHANVLVRSQVPGLTTSVGASDPVLQLQHFEGMAQEFQNAATPPGAWGHREDTYIDKKGFLRIEGRRVGEPFSGSCGTDACNRRHARDDWKVMHTKILKDPNYCMTRSDSGAAIACGASRVTTN